MGPPVARLGSVIHLRGGPVAEVGVLRVSELRGADAASGDRLTEVIQRVVVTEVLAHAEEGASGFGSGLHLGGLTGIEGEGLFAEDGFAVAEGEFGVRKVQGVGSSDEYSLDFRRGAELFGGGEGVQVVRLRVGCGGFWVAPPKADEFCLGGLGEGGDEAARGVVAEAKDGEACFKHVGGTPPRLRLQVALFVAVTTSMSCKVVPTKKLRLKLSKHKG